MTSSQASSLAAIENDQRDLHSLISSIDSQIESLRCQIGNVVPKKLADNKPLQKSAAPRPASQNQAPPSIPEVELRTKPRPSSPPRPDADDLELKFGQIWLVRIGILLLITALIYGSKLAYTHFVTALPAGGKAGLCFLFSGSLLSLGHWLSRKAERDGSAETFKNYARVISGGGLAALYFTTFAIHRIEPLRIIESPLVAGALLLLCALGTLTYALKKQSRTIASTAVVLGYYAAMSGPTSGFSLFSTLLLTGLGVAFLFRARWGAIGFLCLGGTYAALFYWHFLQPDALPLGLPYLAAYWAFFSAGAILPRPGVLANRPRLHFASANNALAFIFGSITILDRAPDLYGRFCLIFGALLIGLIAVSRPPLSQAYLAKGIAVITLGWIALCDGYQLALVLGIQSAALFAARIISPHQGETTHSPILPIASLLATTLATFIALASPTLPTLSGIALAAITLGLAHAWNHFPHPITALSRAGSILSSTAAITLAATVAHRHLSEAHAFVIILTVCCAAIGISLWRPAKLPHLKFVAGLAGVAAPIMVAEPLLFHLPEITYLGIPPLAALSIFWSRVTIAKDLAATRHFPSALAATGFYALSTRLITELSSTSPILATLTLLAPALALGAIKLRTQSLYFGSLTFHIIAIAIALFDRSTTDATLLIPLALMIHAEIARHHHQRRFSISLQIAAALTLCLSALRINPTYATLGIFIAALGLFATGFLLHRNDTRRIALGTIGIALGRILLIDLWQFGTAGRVITLFSLGAGLLALGYLYNRHPSSLKKLL